MGKDILERLMCYNPPDRTIDEQRQVSVDIYDAATEIKRLRDQLEFMPDEIDNN